MAPGILSQTEVEPDLAFLRTRCRPEAVPVSEADLAIVDLFSGCGGLTIGTIEGAARCGRQASLALAVDNDETPLAVLASTLGTSADATAAADLESVLGGFSDAPRPAETALFSKAQGAALLVAGPPCQGHSALNNHTRHDDPRNDLYVSVARAARLIEPSALIIENVRGVIADRRGSVDRCGSFLEELGYQVVHERIDLTCAGTPQRRVRHVLVATRGRPFHWAWPEAEPRSVGWALEDLLEVPPAALIDTPSSPSSANRRRIDWLFDNDSHNLPNEERPLCHRGGHSYRSMYGRLWWNKPAQTITSGFGSMGQGRFVHPLRRRTLTPHEAARLQFLPDYLDVSAVRRRGALAKMVGNAAPPSLTISLVNALCEQGLI